MGVMDILGPVGSVAGGVMDMISQANANKTNAANVDKQIAFQKEQGETQYQRGVEDMKKAGLNPALAYQQGGNTAQTGAAATAHPTMTGTGDKISSALATANLAKQGRLLDAQSAAASAQALKTNTEQLILQPEGMLAESVIYKDANFKKRLAELAGQTFTAGKTEEAYGANLASTRAGTTSALAAAANARASAALSGSAKRLNEQEYLPDSILGKPLQWANATSRGLDILGKGTGLFPTRGRTVTHQMKDKAPREVIHRRGEIKK